MTITLIMMLKQMVVVTISAMTPTAQDTEKQDGDWAGAARMQVEKDDVAWLRQDLVPVLFLSVITATCCCHDGGRSKCRCSLFVSLCSRSKCGATLLSVIIIFSITLTR